MALFFMLKNCYNSARKAYDFMKKQKYNVKDLTLAYFQKKSKLYRAGGYKYATPLKRSVADYQNQEAYNTFIESFIPLLASVPCPKCGMVGLLILYGTHPRNFINEDMVRIELLIQRVHFYLPHGIHPCIGIIFLYSTYHRLAWTKDCCHKMPKPR